MTNRADHRQVSCWLEFAVTSPAVIALQVSVAATAGTVVEETFDVRVDGTAPITPARELATHRSGRVHLVEVPPGRLEVHYSATAATPRVVVSGGDGAAFDDEAVIALRQSRYCPSDALAGFAAAEFGQYRGRSDLASTVADWVFERFAYRPGSSGPLDTALDTLVRHEGVCRDFAHVTIALCRALGIPARLVAVYAPGLSPMDFHAVAEVKVGESWQIVDATKLAPRPSLVRIATGRDAADVAFVTTLRGEVELVSTEVAAVTDGVLPDDDHRGPVVIG